MNMCKYIDAFCTLTQFLTYLELDYMSDCIEKTHLHTSKFIKCLELRFVEQLPMTVWKLMNKLGHSCTCGTMFVRQCKKWRLKNKVDAQRAHSMLQMTQMKFISTQGRAWDSKLLQFDTYMLPATLYIKYMQINCIILFAASYLFHT